MSGVSLCYSTVVPVAASEETPEERRLIEESEAMNNGGHAAAKLFSVAFDPLDGSSIVDANFTVGSIFGVWPGKTLKNRCGREQVAAAMAMYGPRVTMAVALALGRRGLLYDEDMGGYVGLGVGVGDSVRLAMLWTFCCTSPLAVFRDFDL